MGLQRLELEISFANNQEIAANRDMDVCKQKEIVGVV
jgi:hypothetical protein